MIRVPQDSGVRKRTKPAVAIPSELQPTGVGDISGIFDSARTDILSSAAREAPLIERSAAGPITLDRARTAEAGSAQAGPLRALQGRIEK